MLRKLGLGSGSWALLVLAGAAGAACSSSSGSPTPDGGNNEAGTKPGKDGAVDSGVDAPKKSHDAGTDAKHDGEGEAGTPTARFTFTAGGAIPNYLDVPFPSDIYLANGLIMDALPGAATTLGSNSQFITHELHNKNGFSLIAQTIFEADDPSEADGVATIDGTTLPTNEAACISDTSSVFLIDLSLTGTAARIPCRAGFHDDRFLYTADGGAPGTDKGYRPAIAVGPGRGVVLQEGHQYATVMTSRVKTVKGKKLGATSDFSALSDPTTKSSVYTATLATAKTILSSALASDGATIIDIAPFTTSSETKVLLQMRTNLEAVPVPTLAWDSASMAPMGATTFAAGTQAAAQMLGFTDSLDDLLGTVLPANVLPSGVDDPNADLPVRAHNKLAAIGTAVFQAQNYLSPANGYGAVGAATFTYDSNGNVIPDPTKGTAPIWVTFFVPSTPMPPNGYPVVIVQHGLGESRAVEPFNLANTFANAGWMVAAIDSVTFGARASESKYEVDKVNNFAGPYTGPDGIADAVGTPPETNGLDDLFGVLLDIGAIRDQFRQAEIDTSQLARVLASNPNLAPLKTGNAAPMIDGTKIAYFGNSLGGIQGAAAAAIEPLIQNWVLNVAGGGVMTELAPHAPLVAVDLAFAGLNFNAAQDHLNETHPLMNLLQTVMDPGDPIDFAPYVVTSPATVNGTKLPAKNVLQITVLYDEYVANEANEALARAIGMGLATPNQGTNSGVDSTATLQDPSKIADRLPLTNENPDDAGLIHDTPITGTTAVLVQTGPGRHGDNFQAGLAQHTFAIPFNQFTTRTPFVTLGAGSASSDPPFSITCSYLQQQAMAVRFLNDGFNGDTPNVTGFVPAVRDYDGDGTPDSTDPDPNNPNIK